ncbi:Toxin FitB [subsurface metagenome]
MVLFDTDVLSNIVKKNPSERLLLRLKKLPRNVQYTSAINLGEIYYGANRSSKKSRILEAFEKKVFTNLTVLPFDRDSAKIYGDLKAKLEKRGKSKSEPDLRIASIAIQYNMSIVTGNERHFSGIPFLRVEKWL